MRLRGRVGRVAKQIHDAKPGSDPLTVFLAEGPPGTPTTHRQMWGGMAVEIVFDPTAGRPPLPKGLHKLIIGPPGMADWI